MTDSVDLQLSLPMTRILNKIPPPAALLSSRARLGGSAYEGRVHD